MMLLKLLNYLTPYNEVTFDVMSFLISLFYDATLVLVSYKTRPSLPQFYRE